MENVALQHIVYLPPSRERSNVRLLHNEVNIYYILYRFFPNAAAPEKLNVEDKLLYNNVHLNHDQERVIKSLKKYVLSQTSVSEGQKVVPIFCPGRQTKVA